MDKIVQELNYISKQISDEFQTERPKSFKKINANIQKIIKNENVFWFKIYKNFEAFKNINKNFYKIKNLEDFIFYAYYYILQDQKLRIHTFRKNSDFAKLFDKMFEWEVVEAYINLDMAPISYNFSKIFEKVVNIDFTNLKIPKDKFKLKIEKISI